MRAGKRRKSSEKLLHPVAPRSSGIRARECTEYAFCRRAGPPEHYESLLLGRELAHRFPCRSRSRKREARWQFAVGFDRRCGLVSTHLGGEQVSELFDRLWIRKSSFGRDSCDILRLIDEKKILGLFEFLETTPLYFDMR